MKARENFVQRLIGLDKDPEFLKTEGSETQIVRMQSEGEATDARVTFLILPLKDLGAKMSGR